LHVGYYRNQSQQAEAVGAGSDLLDGPDEQWRRIATQRLDVALAGGEASVMRTEFVHPRDRIVAWRWYWIDGHMTASAYAAKALLAWAKLRGEGDDAAVIVLYTRRLDTGESADRRLAAFARDMSPQLLATLRDA